MMHSTIFDFSTPAVQGTWISRNFGSTSLPYGCQPKNKGCLPPKMDGENNGSKPYFLMDDLGGSPYFWFNIHISPTPLAVSPQRRFGLEPPPFAHGV